MKKSVFCLATMLILALGCSYSAVANQRPSALIDSVSVTEVYPGEPVTFKGHGTDPDGQIVAYKWRSSKDGDLGTAATLTVSNLSEGTHTVWFSVRDSAGLWSDEVPANVTVFSSGVTLPLVNSFYSEPGSILRGGSSTLTWDVSGKTVVSISPDIGNVGTKESRVVSPPMTTTYTLKATNEVGSVTATAEVVVVSAPLHVLELRSISGEGGYVCRDGCIGPEPVVGDSSSRCAMQAFLSFDISGIPAGAKIKAASLDIADASVYGRPFSTLGELSIYGCQFTVLRKRDFVVGPGSIPIFALRTQPRGPLSSSLLKDAIQAQVDAGSQRFQLRFQFDVCSCRAGNVGELDYVDLGQEKSRLKISYEN